MKWVSKNFIMNERVNERANGSMYSHCWFIPFTPARPRPTKATYPPTNHSSIWYDGRAHDAFYTNGGVFSHTLVPGCEYTSGNHSYPRPRHWRFYAIYGKRLFSLPGLTTVSQRLRVAWRVCAYNSLYCISLRACVRACVVYTPYTKK